MTVAIHTDPFIAAQVVDLVLKEKASALSPREWKHRIAGYGYAIRETPGGQFVETLPHHKMVAALPS